MDWNGDLRGWLAALGIGLLIGVVRERRSSRDLAAGPSAGTPVRAGLRTHAVLALAAAAAMQLGTGMLAVLMLAIGALVVASYWASHRDDPGMTGEIALLLSERRTATVRAKAPCDLFVLERDDFLRILRDHPQFASAITDIARDRYNKTIDAEHLTGPA